MMKLCTIKASLSVQEVLSAQQAAAIRGGQTQAPPPDASMPAPDSTALMADDKRRQRPSGGTSTH